MKFNNCRSWQVIVADRLADEALWTEALNLGCYDVLMTPFDAQKVLRVVAMAWDFWRRGLETDGGIRENAGAVPALIECRQ